MPHIRYVVGVRQWRRARRTPTGDWRNCGLSLTATHFLDSRDFSAEADGTIKDDVKRRNPTFAETSILGKSEQEQKNSDGIEYSAVSEKQKGSDGTLVELKTLRENRVLGRLEVDIERVEIAKEINLNSIQEVKRNSIQHETSKESYQSSPSSSAEENARHDFYATNPYYIDEDALKASVNNNNADSVHDSTVDKSRDMIETPQNKNDQFFTKIGTRWDAFKCKITDGWQKLEEDELTKKALKITRRRQKDGLEDATAAASVDIISKAPSTVWSSESTIDSATKQLDKVVESVSSMFSNAISSHRQSHKPSASSSAVAKKDPSLNIIPLDLLVKMQSSTLDAIGSLQDQVRSAEIVINIKKRLQREQELNEVDKRDRAALDERKLFLRDRCFKKLFVGEFSAFKLDDEEIVSHYRRGTEVGRGDANDEDLSLTPWKSKLRSKSEEVESEESGGLGALPTSSFTGNWTGMQLKRDDVDETIFDDRFVVESRQPRSKIEGRMRMLFFAMRQADNEAKLGRLTITLTRIVRSNPKLRYLVYEEKMLPFLLSHFESSAAGSALHCVFREALSIVGHSLPPPSRGVRILAMDGGGVRAVVAVLTLKRLQEECGGKPIQELFDYVIGVSTGSILAAMAAIYDCPLDDCEKMYRIMSKDVFDRTPITGAPTLVMRHAYYDTEFWNELLQRDCGQLEMSETARVASIPKVAIVSTAVNLSRMTPYLLRNYHLPLNAPSKLPGTTDVKVWEALRASSAAAGLFQECRLGNVVHWDGGLIANNPTALAVHEAKQLWPREAIQCVVSLGTGRYVANEDLLAQDKEMTPLTKKIGKLIDGATDTECVHTTMQDFLPKASYFRFNPYMSEDILLDETRPEKVDQLMKDGELYLRKNEAKIKAAAKRLMEPRRKWQQWEDQVRTSADKFL